MSSVDQVELSKPKRGRDDVDASDKVTTEKEAWPHTDGMPKTRTKANKRIHVDVAPCYSVLNAIDASPRHNWQHTKSACSATDHQATCGERIDSLTRCAESMELQDGSGGASMPSASIHDVGHHRRTHDAGPSHMEMQSTAELSPPCLASPAPSMTLGVQSFTKDTTATDDELDDEFTDDRSAAPNIRPWVHSFQSLNKSDQMVSEACRRHDAVSTVHAFYQLSFLERSRRWKPS